MNKRMLAWAMAVGLVLGAAGMVTAATVEGKVEKAEAAQVLPDGGKGTATQAVVGKEAGGEVKAPAAAAKPAPAPRKKKAIEGC